MTQLRTTTSETWPATQAFALAAVALLFGVCGGWILRRVTAPPLAQQAAAAPMPTAVPPQTPLRDLGPMAAVPSADLKKAADSEAAPLLEQLKAAPSDAGLLAKLGNIYYDAKLYSDAIQYYERSLKIQPKDTSVRTDLGTAHWYSGDADAAI